MIRTILLIVALLPELIEQLLFLLEVLGLALLEMLERLLELDGLDAD